MEIVAPSHSIVSAAWRRNPPDGSRRRLRYAVALPGHDGAAATHPMRPPSNFYVAAGVAGLRTVMVNVYFVASPTEPNTWVLVDGGLRGSGPRIAREAARHFGENNPPHAIVLTHGHFDHVGGLPWLLQRWQVPVFAHPDELPFINEQRPYDPPDPTVGGGLMALSSPLYPRTAARLPAAVLPLPEHGAVPVLSEWEWIPTPGHSPGHVSFWRPSDRVLISGDAVISTRQESALAVWRQSPEVRPPPAYFTTDWRAAFRSMARLRVLFPAVLASGHGQPLQGEGWRHEFNRLLAEFPERGLPKRGRYVPEKWTETAFA